MLGNFSFGDYFKEKAIPYAWELVTKDFGLPKDRLLVTVFSEDDDAAGDLEEGRRSAGRPDHPHRHLGQFLAHGRYRPVRPLLARSSTTTAPSIPGGPPGSPGRGRRPVRRDLEPGVHAVRGRPARHARRRCRGPRSTPAWGWSGSPRSCRASTTTTTPTSFRALILASAEATGQDPDGPFRASHRVVADHLRSVAFLIADGVLPSNEGRGYVLRRIMRRAMRHAHMMGAREPLMHRLVPALVRQMGAAYPELVRAEALIIETLLLEETRFRQMLDRGLHLLTEETARLGDRQPLPGAVAFRLYDTFGFPLDLTQDALREQGRDGGPRRLRGGDGRTARARPRRLGRLRRGRHRTRLVRAEGEGRRHGVPRLLDRDRGGARSSRSW